VETADKLDQIITAQAATNLRLAVIELQLTASTTRDSDHETRLRAVERWMWGVPASLVAGVAALVATFR
jgi:hypothetical protein